MIKSIYRLMIRLIIKSCWKFRELTLTLKWNNISGRVLCTYTICTVYSVLCTVYYVICCSLELQSVTFYCVHVSNLMIFFSRRYREYAFIRTDEEREQFLYHLLTLTAREFSCFTTAFLQTSKGFNSGWVSPLSLSSNGLIELGPLL